MVARCVALRTLHRHVAASERKRLDAAVVEQKRVSLERLLPMARSASLCSELTGVWVFVAAGAGRGRPAEPLGAESAVPDVARRACDGRMCTVEPERLRRVMAESKIRARKTP